MAVSFNKEVIAEAIQQVLAEDGVTQMFVTNKNKMDIKSAMKKKGVTDVSAVDQAKPGDVIAVEEDHAENPNDESDMAKVQLANIIKYSQELLSMIPDGMQLDAWVQDKLSISFDYIDTVKHYLEGEEYLDANQSEIGENSFFQKRLAKLAADEKAKREKNPGYADASKADFKDLFKKDQSYQEFKKRLDKLEEELAEDYVPRTKEDLVFQYLRDAWQLGALKGKDFNPDEELSTMADSLITYLPDYDSAELEEVRKRGQGTVQKELDAVKKHMMDLAKQYKAGDKSVVEKLKDLTAQKKALEKELEDVVAGIGVDQEYAGEIDEVVQLDEIKAGEFAKIKTGTKIGLKGYGYVTVQDNDGVVLKVKDQFGEIFPINLGQYNEKVLSEGVSCCGRCGRVHESAQDCKKPYISKDSPRHCKNKK